VEKHAEQALPVRYVPDLRPFFIADSARHELRDLSVIAQHTDRRVARARLRARHINQLQQDAVER